MYKNFLCILFLSLALAGCSYHTTNHPEGLVNLQQNRKNVAKYYQDGPYKEEVELRITKADTYIEKALQSGKYDKPAIIFDIDDTLLDKHIFYERIGFRFISSAWRQWIDYAKIPALPPTRDLFVKYVDKVDIFIITSRSVMLRAQTLRNLEAQGY